MTLTDAQKGNTYMILGMIIWSLFPIISLLGLKGIPSVVSLFWVNLFATIFFFAIVIIRGKLFELKKLKVWYYTFGTVIFIDVIFYGLIFYALNKTTPTNAAIVGLFEVVPTYIFFQIFKKEKFKKKYLLGIVLAMLGVLIVLLPKAGGVNIGDFIILFAVFFPPIGNLCQQKTRELISSESALFLRHLLALPILFLVTIIVSTHINDYNIHNVIWWLMINGIFIFGVSQILWVESIHRITVTRVIAVNGLNPIFTVIFAWLLIHQAPTYVQLISLPFLIVSILLLTNFKFRKQL